jgi:hypothetical protein
MKYRLYFVIIVIVLALFGSLSKLVVAQPKGCDGPQDLCQQILDLNQKLAEQKQVTAKFTKNEDKTIEKVKVEEDQKHEETTAKTIAFAAVFAVVLKGILSLLRSWKSYFTTVKGKAWLKVISIGVGLIAFIATNIGLGIPWLQSLILAGGGPGAMMIHDITDLFPVLTGKKTDLPPEANDI